MDVAAPQLDLDVPEPDLSEQEKAVESDDGDAPSQEKSSFVTPKSEPVETEPVELTWEIIEGATERGGDHLVTSTGYKFVRRQALRKNGTGYWICAKKSMGCRATVTQKKDGFTPGPSEHTCLPCSGVACAAKVRAAVNQAAMTQPFTSARQIVDRVSYYQ